MSDLVADGGAGFVHVVDYGAGEGIIRGGGVRRIRAPDDAAGGDLIAGAFDASLINGVADGDVGEAVAVSAHVAGGSEAGAEIGLDVLDGNQHGLFGGAVGP